MYQMEARTWRIFWRMGPCLVQTAGLANSKKKKVENQTGASNDRLKISGLYLTLQLEFYPWEYGKVRKPFTRLYNGAGGAGQ